MITDNSKHNVPAVINEDYEGFFRQELINYLHSPEWNNVETSFKRELQLHITPGDMEMLKKYLREQRDSNLERFNKSGISWFWNKSFIAEENRFDEIVFIKKLYMASDGMIDSKELNEFFVYYCMNRMIESILKGALEYEEKRHYGSFKVFINYGEVKFGGNEPANTEENVDDEDETILKNIIFNSKVFDTNEKLLKLRKVIAHSINMGEYNAMFGEPNPSTIDPDVQGEWYYLMKALEESEVAKKFSVPSFIDQMIDWYPWLFSFETPEDMQAFKRKMEKSISHEKSIWKYGKAKEVTKLKDMWARYNQTNIDYAKVERIFNAAYTGLCVKLVALKQEIAKEKATR